MPEEVPEPEEAGEIPQSRVGRSAKLGRAIGKQATRYAGTAASNLGRSDERKAERLETRHVESALKMASVLGEMKGAAMKIGQMASFIDVDFLPPEYREIYQEQLGKLRSNAPAMPWERVVEVLESEYEGQPLERNFAAFDREATAAASIGQVHRATPARRQRRRGEDPVPRRRRGARVRPGERGHPGPGREGPRPRASTPRRSRARSASASSRSSTTSSRPRTSAPSRAPTTATPSSTCRRCTPACRGGASGQRVGRRPRLRPRPRPPPGRARHLRRDRLPLLLRLDLPPAPLQRRHPPGQLPADGRRPGRLPRLRDDQAAGREPDPARAARDRRRVAG